MQVYPIFCNLNYTCLHLGEERDSPKRIPAPETGVLDDAHETVVLAPAPETGVLVPAPETGVLVPAPETGFLVPAPETVDIVPAPETGVLVPAPETVVLVLSYSFKTAATPVRCKHSSEGTRNATSADVARCSALQIHNVGYKTMGFR